MTWYVDCEINNFYYIVDFTRDFDGAAARAYFLSFPRPRGVL